MSTEKIDELEQYIRDYFNSKLAVFYNAGVRNRLAVALQNSSVNVEACSVFDRFGASLRVDALTAGARATAHGAVPTLHVEYLWKVCAEPVRLQLMIVGEEAEFAKVLDADKLSLQLGIDCNFVKEFKKTVVFKWPGG